MSARDASTPVAGGAAGHGLVEGAGAALGVGDRLASPPGAPVVVIHCDGGSLSGNAGPREAEAHAAGRTWIRVPCVGRVSEGDLLRALRGGAAAVLLVGCARGRCRFHEGDLRAEEVVARVQGVLARHGLSPRRVALIRPATEGEALRAALRTGDELCGERATTQEAGPARWMRRAMPAGAGWPHHGAVQEAALLSLAAPALGAPAPRWAAEGSGRPSLPEGIPTGADLLYGCGLSDLDDLLGGEYGARGVAPQQAALRLLRAAGLSPAVSDRLPACGHDFALAGDHRALSRAAGGVAEALRRSGARRVIPLCPECEATLRRRYPRVGVDLEAGGGDAPEVADALSLLSHRLEGMRFQRSLPVPVAVFADVDADAVEATERRQAQAAALLQAAGYEVVARLPDPYVEPGAQGSAGVRGFVSCDAAARAAQDRLLGVAREAGAARLLCVSPLSAVHLGCALRRGGWRRHRLQVETVYEALAERLLPTTPAG